MTHSKRYMHELDALLRQTEARRISQPPVLREPQADDVDDSGVHDGWASIRPREALLEAA